MEQLVYSHKKRLAGHTYFSLRKNKITLILSDVSAFLVSMLLANVLNSENKPLTWIPSALDWQVMVFSLSGLVSILWFWGSQRHYTYRKPFWDELKDMLSTLSIMALVSMAMNAVFKQNYSVNVWCIAWLFVFVTIPLFRNLAKVLLNKANLWKMPCVIIGDAENAEDVFNAMLSEPSTGFEVRAIVELTEQTHVSQVLGVPYISKREFFSRSEEFHQVFIALEEHQSELRESWIRELSKQGMRNISIVPALRGIPLYGTDVSHFFSHEIMMLRIKNRLPRKSSRAVKRCFDIVGSACLLTLLSPFFLYIAWKVSRDGGSITYGHERVGMNGKKFKCLKFRSMVMNAQEVLNHLLDTDPEAKAEWEREFKLKNDPRITSVGLFLRKTSLDELPQLWNVLKGEMSLVGPRPIIYEELVRYGDDVDYYLCAKPGISGLWQVSGRSDTDYNTRVYLDSWYVKNWSLWNDIVILFKTIHVVLKRDGAY
jgi:Undecaprenyl-phosphate galactose phosphotransferase WbaP